MTTDKKERRFAITMVCVLIFFAGLFVGNFVPQNRNVRTETTTVATFTETSVLTLPIQAPYYFHPVFHVIDGMTNKGISRAYISLINGNGLHEQSQTNGTGYLESKSNYLGSIPMFAEVWAENYAGITVPISISNNVITLRLYPPNCFLGSGCINK